MSVPLQHLAVLAAAHSNYGRWVEIEGIPYAYGSFERTAGFFSSRGATQRFLGIKPFLMKVPRTVDQTIDTLTGGSLSSGNVQFEIADIDDTIVQLLGVGYQTGFTALDSDLTKAATTIPIPSGGGGSFVNGGYCYIGTEAILIGTVGATSFTGCTRGMFRSTPQVFAKGIPIGTRPYTMANRRVWYNQIGLAGQTRQDLTNADDANTCLRVSGLLDNMVVAQQPNSYLLTIKSMESELDKKAFRDLRSWPLLHPFASPNFIGGAFLQVAGYNGYYIDDDGKSNDRAYPPLTADGLPLYAPGERVLVRIDDEIFSITGLSDGGVQFTQRALMGTEATGHKGGAQVQEVVSVVEFENKVGFLWSSKFDAVGLPTGIHADHPLALVLQLLMSTGTRTTGYGSPTNGTNGIYDTLPDGWGMGIDSSRINVQEIETAMLEEPGLRFGGLVLEPTNFVALTREILSFAGYYFFVDIGDEFRIRRLRPPEPDAQGGIRTVDNRNRMRGYHPGWEANWSGAIREVTYKYSYDFLRGDFKVIDIFKLVSGDLYSKGKARTLEYSCKFVYPGLSGIPGEPDSQRFDVHQWLITRAQFFNHRYGRPPPIINEHLTYDNLDLAPGDIVLVTNSEAPNISTGALGITNELGEVQSVSIDDEIKMVSVSILMTGWQLGTYRYIAPSCKILTVDAGGTTAHTTASLTLVDNEFTEPFGPNGLAQTDLFPTTITDSQPMAFSVGGGNWAVDARIWKADLSAHQDIIIDAYAKGPPDTLDIRTADGAVWDFNLAAGYFITNAEYPDQVGSTDDQVGEVLTDKYAYAADSNDTLGSDPADKLFPT